ncbi:hypothetical protein LguiA_030259 [Lonicera macranthoides]
MDFSLESPFQQTRQTLANSLILLGRYPSEKIDFFLADDHVYENPNSKHLASS